MKEQQKEVWLELGFLDKDGGHDMLWYNEGNFDEFPYFKKKVDEWKKEGKRGVYAFARRDGKVTEYLRVLP